MEGTEDDNPDAEYDKRQGRGKEEWSYIFLIRYKNLVEEHIHAFVVGIIVFSLDSDDLV